LMRSTHDKTHPDFIKCTLLPKTTQICFIDNSYFEEMVNKYIYYIQPRSYFHHLSRTDIIDRFSSSSLAKRLSFPESLFRGISFSTLGRNTSIQDDIYVSHKLMYHIKEFFVLTTHKPRTRKLSLCTGRITRKNRGI
jgi:hypothetical protein